jgi:hypothetical protein
MPNNRSALGGLKHVPFFEVVGHEEDDSSRARVATAGLLVLRLIDHWVMAGMVMVQPESQSIRSVRKAIAALPRACPQRDVLFGLVNAMQTSKQVDVELVLPRLQAYARLLEYEEWTRPLASDVYHTACRLYLEQSADDGPTALLARLIRWMQKSHDH